MSSLRIFIAGDSFSPFSMFFLRLLSSSAASFGSKFELTASRREFSAGISDSDDSFRRDFGEADEESAVAEIGVEEVTADEVSTFLEESNPKSALTDCESLVVSASGRLWILPLGACLSTGLDRDSIAWVLLICWY